MLTRDDPKRWSRLLILMRYFCGWELERPSMRKSFRIDDVMKSFCESDIKDEDILVMVLE